MNNKHRKTLQRIFRDAPGDNIQWQDVESLLVALGADVEEGRGSRVTVTLREHVAVFHRPEPVIRKGVVVALRGFLQGAGVSL